MPPAKGMTRHDDRIKTRWAAIYALELRGLDLKQIAEVLQLSSAAVSTTVNDPRYIAYREEHLTALDSEFVMMKPLAFNALKAGLNSQDENTALRASEQWFKGAGFGGFSKDPPVNRNVTAEDVAAQLLTGVQVNVAVQVNTGLTESEK